jgi:hypothetical protein
MAAPAHRKTLPPKMVLTLTFIHGLLLTGALLLRSTLAPPLSMCERGLSRAWATAERGDLETALALARATEGRMVQIYGEGSHEASLAGQVVAEFYRQGGELQRSQDLYLDLIARSRPPGQPEPSWMVAERAVGLRQVRRRPTTFGEGWTIDLPTLEAGLEQVRTEASRAG